MESSEKTVGEKSYSLAAITKQFHRIAITCLHLQMFFFC